MRRSKREEELTGSRRTYSCQLRRWQASEAERAPAGDHPGNVRAAAVCRWNGYLECRERGEARNAATAIGGRALPAKIAPSPPTAPAVSAAQRG